jgi:hypothetical protein
MASFGDFIGIGYAVALIFWAVIELVIRFPLILVIPAGGYAIDVLKNRFKRTYGSFR